MLSQELCQKLKDAGFPQQGNGEIELKHSCSLWAKITKKYPNGDRSKSCKCWGAYQPTLSELIEASGVFKLYCTEGRFIAQAEMGDPMPECDTPEEAVANLYLELYK